MRENPLDAADVEQESMIRNQGLQEESPDWRHVTSRRRRPSCMRFFYKQCYYLIIIVLIFFLIGLLSSIDGNIKRTQETSSAFNFEEIIPTLNTFETNFASILVSALSTKLLFLKFPLTSLLLGGESRPLLFSATFTSGAFVDDQTVGLLNYPAENTDETVFYFKLAEDFSSVDLYRKQLKIRTSDIDIVESLIESIKDEWVVSLPVVYINETQPKSKDDSGVNIDIIILADSLITNGFYITGISESFVSNFEIELSTLRGFPNNADLSVQYQFKIPESFDTLNLRLRYSIALLPSDLMEMRLADERVGYFTTSYVDVGDHREVASSSRPSSLLDSTINVINRRRLSIGGDPLIYYIDPSVPDDWREAIKSGVEAWQPAFAAIGYDSNIIKAVLPGDSDWPEDYDPADIRFNSVTWAIDLNEVFAIGPATIDPRTGEILRSNIVFTSGWIKAWVGSLEKLGGVSVVNRLLRKLKLQHKFELSTGHAHHHDFHNIVQEHAVQLRAVLPHLFEPKSSYRKSLRFHSHHSCQGIRIEHSDSFSSKIPHLRKVLDIDSDLWAAVIKQGLTEVTVHEVGHTLGLRHNFKGSIESTLQELQDPDYASSNGLTASVMDYLPINIVSAQFRSDFSLGGVSSDHHFYTQVVGSYDYWAIEYGYKEVEYSAVATLMLEQYDELEEVAALALPFGTDEDLSRSDGIDPTVSVFDLGSDPLAYYKDQIQLISEIRDSQLDVSVQVGEPFTHFSDYESLLIRLLEIAGLYAGKYIGGVELAKQRRESSDSSLPYAAVDPEKQREALSFIIELLTGSSEPGGNSTASFLPKYSTLGAMVMKGGDCSSLETYCYAIEPYDVVEYLEAARENILLNIFTESRLSMVRLNAWGRSASDDAFTLLEFFSSVTDAIFGTQLLNDPRVESNENWSLMLFWVNLLMSISNAGKSTAGSFSAYSSGEIYRVVSSSPALSSNSTSWGLNKEILRRVQIWETAA